MPVLLPAAIHEITSATLFPFHNSNGSAPYLLINVSFVNLLSILVFETGELNEDWKLFIKRVELILTNADGTVESYATTFRINLFVVFLIPCFEFDFSHYLNQSTLAGSCKGRLSPGTTCKAACIPRFFAACGGRSRGLLQLAYHMRRSWFWCRWP